MIDEMKQNTKNYDKLCNDAKYHQQNPVIRNQANARERFRTHSVNSAFISLRELIPTEPKTRKLSKIETLRLAKSYIEHLAAMLVTGRTYQPCAHQNSPQSDSVQSLRSRTICTFCLAAKSQS